MFFGDRIKVWLRQRMYNKMEDAIRSSMGMPSRKEEKRRRKEAEKKRSGWRTNSARTSPKREEEIIPREYAEDVEFTEYKEYSSSTTVSEEKDSATGDTRIKVEKQVEDADFVEIK